MKKTKGGIYIITSPSGKIYVGSTVDFRYRWGLHLSGLRKGHHHNQGLQRAWNKYGPDTLVFQPIFCCPREELLVWEQQFIDDLKPEYNASRYAMSRLGTKNTAEHNAKIAAANTGKKFSPEQRAAMSESRRGRRLSPESLEKRRDILSGDKKDAWRASVSKGKTGARQSEKTRKKRADSLRGRKASEETKAKLSVVATNRVYSEETRAKMRASAIARCTRERLDNLTMDMLHAVNTGVTVQPESAC